MTEAELREVDGIIEACGRGPDALVPLLQAVQHRFRHLPEEALRRICETTEIRAADVDAVSTFFPHFRRTPAGKHTVSVCDGTACHLKGADDVYAAVRAALGIPPESDTDADRLFTVQKVRCLGCCTLAPAVQIDHVTYGHITRESAPAMLRAFLAQEAAGGAAARGEALPAAPDGAPEIRVGLGSCCVAGGSARVRDAVEDTVRRHGLSANLKPVSCVGMCHQTPLLQIVMPGDPVITYAKVSEDDVAPLLLKHLAPASPLRRAGAALSRWAGRLYDGGVSSPGCCSLGGDHPSLLSFLGPQRHIATEFCGELDPASLEDYRARGGFEALRKCLQAAGGPAVDGGFAAPEAVIAEIERAGLRGRGGAGFPTGRKWRAVREAGGEEKVVVCNGDEGDPGAFMDRMILESYPFRVIEGMLIASVAAGARRGVFYIRAEYPLAVERVRRAIAVCEEAGLLGENILGSRHAFRAEVREGAGAFVCGEETALLASLEGRRPTPRFRPPFPAQRGLNGVPTLINNVETLAMTPWILRHGADAFTALGTGGSRGTKVFALAGKVRRGGLIEVPMGVTVRRIVEEAGGGVNEGRTFKAVQVGGPSGGCIPDALADLPVDYEALTGAGAMMGSGGMVVMDDTDCMVEMTRYFLSFTQLESCGKCVPCRVGTALMLDILTRLCEGRGTERDLEELERTAVMVKAQSLCGLGRTAPNPVLSGLKHFRHEFEAHVRGRCPAHRCKALVTYSITDACIGCTKCAQVCPADAIAPLPYQVHEVDMGKCVRCNACYDICPAGAVKVE